MKAKIKAYCEDIIENAQKMMESGKDYTGEIEFSLKKLKDIFDDMEYEEWGKRLRETEQMLDKTYGIPERRKK